MFIQHVHIVIFLASILLSNALYKLDHINYILILLLVLGVRIRLWLRVRHHLIIVRIQFDIHEQISLFGKDFHILLKFSIVFDAGCFLSFLRFVLLGVFHQYFRSRFLDRSLLQRSSCVNFYALKVLTPHSVFLFPKIQLRFLSVLFVFFL